MVYDRDGDGGSERVTLTMTRRELDSLIEFLKELEEHFGEARQHELDVRIHRTRLEGARLASTLPPPPDARLTTRYMKLDDLPKPDKSKG